MTPSIPAAAQILHVLFMAVLLGKLPGRGLPRCH
jgi:hypothetical protein